MIAAGTTGLIAATAAGPARAAARGRPEAADGTPEQVHLTWGSDPTRMVTVSWASPGRAERPRVRIGQRVIAAAERACTDPLTGAVTWTYHTAVDGLRPGATYGYAVTADNDASAADPFSATFTTAPGGRAAFRFTSFGDLAAGPEPRGAGLSSTGLSSTGLSSTGLSSTGPAGAGVEAAYAVGAVEAFQPLFHLLNGDPAASRSPGAVGPAARAQARRDFGNNVQASAAYRPWLPVPGDYELEPGGADHGLASYLTRYTLPPNGVEGLEGRWYAFRVGTVLFVCLSGDDVAFGGGGAFGGGSAFDGGGAFGGGGGPLPPDPAGGPSAAAARYGRGYSGGAQTRWLESTLAAARADASIDWIVVQLHQCACSSAAGGGSSDLGVRQEWLPLFDTYEVDLVLSGHDRGYERSFPVRGADAGAGTDIATGAAADTRRPRPVTVVDSGVFDTSQGTVHLVLGSGTQDPGGPGRPWLSPGVARVITRPAPSAAGQRPAADQRATGGPGLPGPDAVEAATWSARRAPAAGYGIAVFDVSPGSEAGGQTSITVRYYHAVGPELADADLVGPAAGGPGSTAGDYTHFETFTLVRPRSDGRRWHPKA
jgi:Purple acid Phosphatase, N-terminal domain